jgi:NADP-reducing hydrogenase subunit HndB
MKLNSFEELDSLRNELQAQKQELRKNETKIVIGMGTCGIAAGARDVVNSIYDELTKRHLNNNITVSQTGCIGLCEKEVLIDIERPGEKRITYGEVKVTDVPRIISEHVVNGRIVRSKVVGKIDA